MHQTDVSRILEADEIDICLTELMAKTKRKRPSKRAAVNLIVFRLASAGGLRRKEIVGLNMGDVMIGGRKPFIQVRAAITKANSRGKRFPRQVPLTWSLDALADITDWRDMRISMGATSRDPFVCSLQAGTVGRRLNWSSVARIWRTAIKPLGPDRVRQLSIHQGRHTFCSHAIHSGRPLTQVRDAAGHANVGTTDIYSHALGDEGEYRQMFKGGNG